MASILYVKLHNYELEKIISQFFAQIYYPKDTRNKNKFKAGKLEINKTDNTCFINIYGKPRNYKKNIIKKKNMENSYKYIYPFYRMDTYFGFDVASDDTVYLKPSKTYDD